MAQFSLVDKVPKGHTFRDEDGQVYAVPATRMFGTLQFAQLVQLQEDFPAAMAEVRTAGKEEEKILPAVKRLDQVVNDFFHMLVPKMPLDRVYEIPTVIKTEFIRWWQLEERKAQAGQAAGEAQAGKRPIRDKRSPASSASTQSTRKNS